MEGAERARRCLEQQRLLEHTMAMKERRKLYQVKDQRTHLEREAEHIKRREASKKKIEAEQQGKEAEELKECTFKPTLIRRRESDRHRPTGPRRLSLGGEHSPSAAATSGAGTGATERGTDHTVLASLAERWRQATGALQEISRDEARLQEELRDLHARTYERVQREETERMVAMLQGADAAESYEKGHSNPEIMRRVGAALAGGVRAESMQHIVGELVECSKEEIQRRVHETFRPRQMEAECELHTRRLAVVHEFEAVEAHALALRGGALYEKAKALGIEFGFAEQARRVLVSKPPAGVAIGPTSSLGGSSLQTLPPLEAFNCMQHSQWQGQGPQLIGPGPLPHPRGGAAGGGAAVFSSPVKRRLRFPEFAEEVVPSGSYSPLALQQPTSPLSPAL